MKKIILTTFLFLFLFSYAVTLKGGVVEEHIPKGFFGSWAVVSKLKSCDDVKLFNYESKDIWILGGYSNVLILQNLQSGAYSEINIKESPIDGKTLTFERKKTVNKQSGKIIYKEQINFVLQGDKFSGTDDFIVEQYDDKNILSKRSHAKYIITARRISS